jgi:hypothetical protein
MKKLESAEFERFLNGEIITQPVEITRKNFAKEIDTTIHFVIVKTVACSKCEKLLKKADEVFKNMAGSVAYYVYDMRAQNIAQKFSELDITAVPVIITRFWTKDGILKLGKIVADYEEDFMNLTNIFDAINDNDQGFFGYNEFDEVIDEDHAPMMNRILRMLYGELDSQVERDRNNLKQAPVNKLIKKGD